MTPEERAEQVWDIIGAHPDEPTNDQDYSTIIGVIAAAIRAAENDALERAAGVARRLTGEDTREALGANAVIVASQIENAIRALKGEA